MDPKTAPARTHAEPSKPRVHAEPGSDAKLKLKLARLWPQTRHFLADVRVELSKVTWPTWEELRGQTIVVIIAVLMIAAFVGLVDVILSNTIKLLVTRLTT